MVSTTDFLRLGQFLAYEARLADEHRYEDWLALWDDDALYWVPAGAEDLDPARSVSYIYDNRSRLGTRIRQLSTGERHASLPTPRSRRLISNIEVRLEGGDWVLEANFLLPVYRGSDLVLWTGRTHYRVRERDGEMRLGLKKVMLSNIDQPIPTIGVLL